MSVQTAVAAAIAFARAVAKGRLKIATGKTQMINDRKTRTFAYARASTKMQIDSPDVQKDLIRKYAVFNSLGDVTFFVDPAKSAKFAWEDREAGKALFAQLRPGDSVIIAKLDRAFRRLKDCCDVLEKFKRMGLKLHVVNMLGGAIDLSSPMGCFLVHILAAFAELERAFISERTKDGLARKKRTGVSHTRFPGYGFRWKKVWLDGKHVKIKERDDDERNVMRSIVEWRSMNNAMSWDEIRNHLTYTLKLVTKEGTLWDNNRIQRACKAEMILRLNEERGSR
jgi:DNA invertase Pin-like site-specific DNA recombinase